MSTEEVPTDPRTELLVEDWKRKLIDLTRRNRALNFKPTRVSTVAVIDESPAEIFRRLCLRGQPMRFRALEDAPANPAETGDLPASPAPPAPPQEPPEAPPAGTVEMAAAPPATAEDDLLDVAADDALVETGDESFIPYEAAPPHEKHTDEWLQTASPPEALDKSLRRIDDLAQSTIEEQGVNTLFLTLGMLHYRGSTEGEEVSRAPLLMLPVTLTRKSARTGYVLRAAEDEPLVNPALAELLRRDFRLDLPDLPPAEAMAEDYNLHDFLAEASRRVAEQKRWAVKDEIFLALFSFQKLVMYKDLETHGAPAARHRLVRQLATREGSGHIGMPPEVRAIDLDREFPPESTFQVVDADSSQMRALAAVARQHDLVIEGPPGTGKSQTITNLIATTLAAGKTVLFVAEKQAALSVVHSRLTAAGLGEFCLELHAAKANKRAVLRQVAEALDASLQRPEAPGETAQRLPAVRNLLNEYVAALHAPFGALGLSPFRVYVEFARVLDAPHFPYEGAAEEVTAAGFEDALRALDTLAATAAALARPPAEHPWRDATKPLYLPTELEVLAQAATTLEQEILALAQSAEAAAGQFGFPSIATFDDVAVAAEVGAHLARSPGAPLEVLQGEAWDEPPPAALDLIERGRALSDLQARLQGMFTDEARGQDHAADISFVEEKLGGALSFLAPLSGRFRAVKRRWLGYRLAGYSKPLAEQATDLKLVGRLQREQDALRDRVAEARALFGAHWKAGDSDWDALERYVEWVVGFRRICTGHRLVGEQAAAVASRAGPDVTPLLELAAAAEERRRALALLAGRVGWPDDYLTDLTFAGIAERIRAVSASTDLAPQWAAFATARQAVMSGPAGSFSEAALSGRLAFADLRRCFTRAFYGRWLSTCLRSRMALERFNPLGHEERVAEFRRLDAHVLAENRARLVAQLRDRVQARLKASDVAAGMPVLRRELARQRGHQPLRHTLHEAGAAIRAIKPCFMMSPLTVAQYLDGATPDFDLVVFDEASQLRAEDAAGAIIRARQLVVVGDPKQLPPTTFFTLAPQAGPSHDAHGAPLFSDPESILEDFMGAGMATCRLKWHYRSAHESLISFSNQSFYDGELLTFPSVDTGTDHRGVGFELVDGGVYEGNGINPEEARHVAEAVVAFARRQMQRHASAEPVETLGVGTFNLRQQLAILDELERRRREEPAIEPFFARDVPEPFFVKNLENIQGDERDVIFLSVTYGRSPDGRVRRNFGPLNGENGWRRLNVLTTRARRRMQVFASMRGDDIEVSAESTPGPRLLREFLLFAERGLLDGKGARAGSETEGLFMQDVARELKQRGVAFVPRVGMAGYRIDLGVVDEAFPGSYLCGLEGDGAAYAECGSARDRDRLRQQVLESRGWTLHRVWSTGWFLDRRGQIERLARSIEETRRKTAEKRESEGRAREAAAHREAARAAEETEQAQVDAAPEARRVDAPYTRPPADPYVVTEHDGRKHRGDLLDAPESQLLLAVVKVVETEAPVQHGQLCARVAGMWGARAGSRAAQKITAAIRSAERAGLVRSEGDFWHRLDGQCRVRSRAGTRMRPEHIAPEEYAAAVRLILEQGHGFTREQLVTEVRAVFGFARTGPVLDEAVRNVIDDLLAREIVGEGSTGIRLRR